MRVFDLLTTNHENSHRSSESVEETTAERTDGEKIKKYSDTDLPYDQIAMPEIEVTVSFVDKEERIGDFKTLMKVKQVLRYQHLSRSSVDDRDYPANQEYFLYSNGKV